MLTSLLVSFALAAEPAAPSAAPPAAPVQRHLFAPTALRLDLHVEAGAVSVRTDPYVGAPEVRVVPAEGTCDVARDTRYGPSLDVTGCRAEVEVIVPRTLAVHLSVGDGDVALATSGPVRVRVGRGDVTGSARGPVRVAVEEGAVALEGLTTRPRVTVARGTVALAYLDTP